MRSLLSCERGACGEATTKTQGGKWVGEVGGSATPSHPPPSSLLPPASSLQPPSQPPSSLQTPASQPSTSCPFLPACCPKPPKHFWNISCGLPSCKSLHGFSKTLCRSLTRMTPHWSPRQRPGLPAFQGRRTHCTAPAPSWLVPEATSLGLWVQGQPLPLTSG